MNSLWKLLLSAQESPHGIPPKLIEEKKAEIRDSRANQEKVSEGPKVSAIEELKRQDEEGAFRGRGRGRGMGFRGRGNGRGGFDVGRYERKDDRGEYRRREDRDYRAKDEYRDRRERDDRRD